jgi:hypothetical protein
VGVGEVDAGVVDAQERAAGIDLRLGRILGQLEHLWPSEAVNDDRAHAAAFRRGRHGMSGPSGHPV